MTKRKLLRFYVKLDKKLDILEEAARILADEPFASREPDNDAFCDALQKRIEKLRAVSVATETDLFSGNKQRRSKDNSIVKDYTIF